MLGVIILGLASGGIYVLAALGIVTVYRGAKVLNLALGGIAVWGGYLFSELRDQHGMGGLPAAILAVLAGAAFGAVAYLLVIRPIRSSTELRKLVMALAMFSALTGAAQLAFGSSPRIVNSSLPTKAIKIFGTDVGEDRLLILCMSLVVAGLLSLWSSRARIALAMRAVADNERGLSSLGYSPHLLGVLSWALGSALAALSGVLLAPITGLSPASLGVVLVPALVAGLLGRFDSYGWAIVGGLGLGVMQALITRYIPGNGWSDAAPGVVVVVVLMLRRDREANRSRVSEGIPLARELTFWNVIPLAGLAGFLVLGSGDWVAAATTSLCFVLLGLSLVVIVGYGNQISLVQMATAGLGALIAAHLMHAWGLPFVLVPVIGALVGALVGVIVGIPALRLSGVNLAVATVAVSQAVEAEVFDNNSINGGFGGLQLDNPTFFGKPIDTLFHATGYGLFVLGWVVLGIGAVIWMRRSPFGQRLLSVRTNERAAAAVGVNVARTKVIAFVIASMLAGIAGVLLAFRSNNLALTSGFGYTDSINLVVLGLIAGITSSRGAIIGGIICSGGVFFNYVTHWTFVSNNYALISGVLLILAVLQHPSGVSYVPERSGPRTRLPEEVVAGRTPERMQTSGVSVAFGGVHALFDVSLQILPGEVLGLVGPNGAGKTTLLDAISGFTNTQGSVRLGEMELARTRPGRRAAAGVARVFQGVELFEDLTVAQNLMMPIAAGSWGRHVPEAAADFMAWANMGEDLEKLPSSLSLGRRKLVGVARALMTNPKVVLLDEPAAGLSPDESAALGAAVRKLADVYGLGIALIDHDLPLVMATSDRVTVLADGKVIATGTPSDILENPLVKDAYIGGTLGTESAGVSLDYAAAELGPEHEIGLEHEVQQDGSGR